jgi:toxin HigB-1
MPVVDVIQKLADARGVPMAHVALTCVLDYITRRVMLVVMIRSFRDATTERLWSRQRVKAIDPRIQRVALRKLAMLDAAEVLEDLRVPPGNRLEALKGDRAGQHSIRINQQWRICFVWTTAGPEDVEIVDYH